MTPEQYRTVYEWTYGAPWNLSDRLLNDILLEHEGISSMCIIFYEMDKALKRSYQGGT